MQMMHTTRNDLMFYKIAFKDLKNKQFYKLSLYCHVYWDTLYIPRLRYENVRNCQNVDSGNLSSSPVEMYLKISLPGDI